MVIHVDLVLHAIVIYFFKSYFLKNKAFARSWFRLHFLMKVITFLKEIRHTLSETTRELSAFNFTFSNSI